LYTTLSAVSFLSVPYGDFKMMKYILAVWMIVAAAVAGCDSTEDPG
jgi:hypothetical protein